VVEKSLILGYDALLLGKGFSTRLRIIVPIGVTWGTQGGQMPAPKIFLPKNSFLAAVLKGDK
jgi:hypothetical protein